MLSEKRHSNKYTIWCYKVINAVKCCLQAEKLTEARVSEKDSLGRLLQTQGFGACTWEWGIWQENKGQSTTSRQDSFLTRRKCCRPLGLSQERSMILFYFYIKFIRQPWLITSCKFQVYNVIIWPKICDFGYQGLHVAVKCDRCV